MLAKVAQERLVALLASWQGQLLIHSACQRWPQRRDTTLGEMSAWEALARSEVVMAKYEEDSCMIPIEKFM